MTMMPWLVFSLCSLVVPAIADSNGMDMSMDVPMDLAVGNMLPYAHFTPGDIVWFAGWVPGSVGTMVGACIAMFLLAMLERWVAACFELATQHWAESCGGHKRLPPFVPEFEITRGVLFAAHSFLRIALMLAAMTFQLAFILSIAIGSGVGEALFGRFSALYEH